MPVRVKVSMDKQLENFMKKGLHFYGLEIQNELKEFIRTELQLIADNALRDMRSFITVHSKNPEGRLENALTVEFKENRNTISFGIGDRDRLTEEAPYWYVLNYGVDTSGKKFIPTGFIGYVNDGRPIAGEVNKTGDRFEASVTEGYLIEPKTFTPVPYITVGVSSVKRGMRELHSKIRNVSRQLQSLRKMKQ